jgi:hypothetical protein
MARHGAAGAHKGFQPIRQPLGAFDQKAQIVAQWLSRGDLFLHLPTSNFSRGTQAQNGRFRRPRRFRKPLGAGFHGAAILANFAQGPFQTDGEWYRRAKQQ